MTEKKLKFPKSPYDVYYFQCYGIGFIRVGAAMYEPFNKEGTFYYLKKHD